MNVFKTQRYEAWKKTQNNIAIVIQKQTETIVEGVFGEKIFRTLTEANEELEKEGFLPVA